MKVAACLFLLMVTPLAATAQGVFNMGGLTQTLTIPTDQPEARRARDTGAYRTILRAPPTRAARPASGASRAAFAYNRDPAITRRVQQRFVARLASPQARAEAAASMGGQTANITRGLRAFGMSYTNLADAQATYLITAWQITHGRYKDVPAQYRAVSQQMADAGVKVGLNRISNADKQELAETLLYDAAFMGGLVQRAQKEPAVRRQIVSMATSGTRDVFGLDIAKLRLTSAGLTG